LKVARTLPPPGHNLLCRLIKISEVCISLCAGWLIGGWKFRRELARVKEEMAAIKDPRLAARSPRCENCAYRVIALKALEEEEKVKVK